MKVSVITVCYNAIHGIERTIQSVLSQSYDDIEYIVIDGSSTDGTIDVIQKYRDKIAYFVSEPDGGIYDAMNKGIKAATGEWINFLNAGDLYFDKETVSKVFSCGILPDADVVYGYQVHAYSYGRFVRKRLPLSFFNTGMPNGHGSSFVRTGLMKQYGFDTRYRIAADYNFFYHLYVAGRKFQPVDVIVSEFESMDGLSSSAKTTMLTNRETSMINGSYSTLRYKKQSAELYVRLLLKKWLSIFSKDYVASIQRKQRERNDEYIPLDDFLSDKHI